MREKYVSSCLGLFLIIFALVISQNFDDAIKLSVFITVILGLVLLIFSQNTGELTVFNMGEIAQPRT